MNNPRTPRSSAITPASTPARTPSIVDRFEEELRRNVFAFGRDITRQAVESGLWYDFGNGDVDSPEILQWRLLRPEDTSILCGFECPVPMARTMEELLLAVDQWEKDVVCSFGLMSCINILIFHVLNILVGLPVDQYTHTFCQGIPRFNWHGIEIVPTNIFQLPDNPIPLALPALTAPQFPPPPVLAPQFPSTSLSRYRLLLTAPQWRPVLIVWMIPLPSPHQALGIVGLVLNRNLMLLWACFLTIILAPPSKMPRLKGKGRAAQQAYVISDSDDEAMPPSPTPAPRQHVHKKHELPPSYATSVSIASRHQAGSSRAVVHSQPPSRYPARLPYEPSERFFGDCMGLEEPIDTPMLAVRNSDIPPLTQEETAFYLESLQQPEGVRHWIFWQLVDHCNCGRYYTKTYLHQLHIIPIIRLCPRPLLPAVPLPPLLRPQALVPCLPPPSFEPPFTQGLSFAPPPSVATTSVEHGMASPEATTSPMSTTTSLDALQPQQPSSPVAGMYSTVMPGVDMAPLSSSSIAGQALVIQDSAIQPSSLISPSTANISSDISDSPLSMTPEEIALFFADAA
ncbi:hypothetical protein M422DRAFT_45462 [Sphaerobolus stellatus SS14]|nr:hypothetical protein M422DRAFT_45462 [Sphaerobolus stellatus SS14]